MTDIKTDTCWADPLTRSERGELAKLLGRHCRRFWDAATTTHDGRRATSREIFHDLACSSAEMSDLHLDVTERAELASDDPRRSREA